MGEAQRLALLDRVLLTGMPWAKPNAWRRATAPADQHAMGEAQRLALLARTLLASSLRAKPNVDMVPSLWKKKTPVRVQLRARRACSSAAWTGRRSALTADGRRQTADGR